MSSQYIAGLGDFCLKRGPSIISGALLLVRASGALFLVRYFWCAASSAIFLVRYSGGAERYAGAERGPNMGTERVKPDSDDGVPQRCRRMAQEKNPG